MLTGDGGAYTVHLGAFLADLTGACAMAAEEGVFNFPDIYQFPPLFT